MTAPCTPFTGFYIGKPGAMLPLDPPDGGFTGNLHRGEQNHKLASGGTAVTRRPKIKRSWPLTWSVLDAVSADTLLRIYAGQLGAGPYRLVDPTWQNMLSVDTSGCCARLGSINPFTVPAGQTAVPDPTVAPPTDAESSGVIRWHGAGNTDYLVDGSHGIASGDANTLTAVPVLADQPVTASVYARIAAGAANARVVIGARSGVGADLGNTVGATVALTTNWQRLDVTAAAGAIPALYAMFAVQCLTAAAPEILIAGPQIEYNTGPSPFGLGLGVPRVVVAGGSELKVPMLGATSFTLPLEEV